MDEFLEKKIIISHYICEESHQFCEEIWSKPLKSQDLRKIRKNIRKPDRIPDEKFVISHLRSKTSILGRNMVKTIALLSEDLKSAIKKNPKRFSNRSFAHKVKIDYQLFYFNQSIFVKEGLDWSVKTNYLGIKSK